MLYIIRHAHFTFFLKRTLKRYRITYVIKNANTKSVAVRVKITSIEWYSIQDILKDCVRK